MKHTINVYVIEDNLSHLKEIKKTIELFDNSSSIVNFSIVEISNYIEFYKNIDSWTLHPESLFIIDIHLQTYFNGLDLAKKIREISDEFSIIFLTNDPNFGIHAINTQVNPFSYILKKVEPDLFFKNELHKVLNKLQSKKHEQLYSEDFLTVKVGLEKVLINISDILYISTIKGWRGKVILKTTQTEIICNGKLSNFKDELNSAKFFLNAKSVILNYHSIQSFNRIEGTVTFLDASELFVGTSIVNKLNKLYDHN